MVRWYWPGGDVRDEELRREIRLLDEAHFGGAEIQPFRFGLDPKAPPEVARRVDDYLTPSFFGPVRAAVEEAADRGMWVDYTFGSGWPFGGGENITPELALLELRAEHQSLRGPSRFAGPIPWPEARPGFASLFTKLTEFPDKMPDDWARRLAARERLVAVVAVRGDAAVVGTGPPDIVGRPVEVVKQIGRLDEAAAVDLTSRVTAERGLEWDVPEGSWQLFTFVQGAADARVLAGVGDTPQLVLDHFKRAALDSHIQAVGEAAKRHLGEHFGTALRAVFCDSLELATHLYWTDSFLADFRRLRGYDLTLFLPLIAPPGYEMTEIGERVRHDYLRTVSDLLIENFYAPFAEWAERNRLLARVQAHGAPADVLRIYGLSHIPETESLFARGRYDFLKFAASAAHLYGRSVTASESFVWISEEYQTTPEKIKRYSDELLTAGVNQIVYGGFPYEYLDRPEPGWYPFVSPFPYASHVNHHDPFWPFLGTVNDYLTRLQYFLRVGTNVAPVALYRGTMGYQAPAAGSTTAQLGERLLAAGYNFDHINAHALLGSRVEGGQLVSPGGATYRQLILVDEARMSVEVVSRLGEFAAAGLPVLFVGVIPAEESGYLGHRANTAAIARLMAAIQEPSTESTRPANVRRVKDAADAITALRDSIRPNLRFEGDSAGVFFTEAKIGAIHGYFLRNGTAERRSFAVEFPAPVRGSPEVWDPWTGGIAPLREFERRVGGVRIPVVLEPYGSTLIVFDPAVRHAPARPAPVRAPVTVPPPLPVGGPGRSWSFRAIGKDRQGNDEIHQLELRELVDWSKHPELRNFSGTGRYAIEVDVSPELVRRGLRVVLDLGEVKDVAQVRVNDRDGPTLLLRPYRAEITDLVRAGSNRLEVTVTNALLNRMLGSGIEMGTVFRLMGQRPEPLPAGLLGPVRLVFAPQPG
jgi:hypothetical protein